MSHLQSLVKQNCTLLAVLCGKFVDKRKGEVRRESSYPFPELVSAGRLEVHTLTNPTFDSFRETQRALEANIIYFQGEHRVDEEKIGSIVWENADLSEPQTLSSLISSPLPTIVYLEAPNSEKMAQALHAKGVPYVIYWKNAFSSYAASIFRLALLSVLQSSCSHTWDAFQLANASFQLYCVRNNHVFADNNQKNNSKLGPRLLGEAPKIAVSSPEREVIKDEDLSDTFSAIKIYDEHVEMRFLVCGVPCTLDSCFLGSLEDGLNALLNIEIRGSKLHNRVSATPPPLQAGTFARGVVTMRCDLTTCSSAHLSLLVSGSPQTCFDDQLLESHIKKVLIENSQLVHASPTCDESKSSLPDSLSFGSIACGASVFEVRMKVPAWAAQVLKHLAPEISYRSLVAIGIASVQGTPVASFEKEDADRLLFFCKRQAAEFSSEDVLINHMPRWCSSLFCDRFRPNPELKPIVPFNLAVENGNIYTKIDGNHSNKRSMNGNHTSVLHSRKKLKVAAMRPIPHLRQHKTLPFPKISLSAAYEGSQAKPNPGVVPVTKSNSAAPSSHRKSVPCSFQTQQVLTVSPVPMMKHGCNRAPIQVCSEEEFLKDVMEFLVLRGHNRLVPQGGLPEFPDAILNAKRLDLYNLYREVVSRGGFYVGNGINWKGQVFSKMRNHTLTNRMTGVGNTLKRHYETYLLEYELAHDDVDGECCLLCNSSAPGDWVNCGLCGEWAHFGCDRRPGLGTFKDYAKTDGLEYICPHCSLTNCSNKTKPLKMANGYSSTTVSRHL
ncbi:AT-rich interactive domain-containing protein 4-like [Dendrobium catenatum]|uniref:AT-rich interactive domain-containing protein 4 n=1 Tax=Dendrobium catenatum TaxID=906689 RepID=A0A2I0WDV2_9ASPA|nr:AT-rich interactive domain-containing protein 4-like [Dendrobium catenatum]PKU73830.1 AT-rich interactive domain-containing protein 4 [Dendrobium catenatum]